jgi:hypothetical protein
LQLKKGKDFFMAMEFNPVSQDSSQSIVFPWQSDYSPTTTFSLCCWANVRAIAIEYNTFFTRNDHMNLQIHYSGVGIQFAFWVSGGTWRSVNDGLAIPIGTWFHSCGTYNAGDSTQQMKIYRDSQLITTGTYTDTAGYDNSNLQIAGNVYAAIAPGRFVLGRLEDIRMYNRALSQAEVETIYNCRGHDGIVDSLAFRCPLNSTPVGQSEYVVKDISEPPNDGTAWNGPKGYESYLSFRKKVL